MEDKFISCECLTEGILLKYEEDGETFISVWEQYYGDRKTSFKQKLRLIFNTLKYGSPYGDQLILGSVKRKQLIEALQEHEKQYQLGLLEKEGFISKNGK